MFNWLPSIADSIRYPNYRDFISMGLGIEARQHRCSKYWDSHFKLCKQFQSDALAEWTEQGAVALLGAGRLLDIDVALLKKKFSAIDLYDADPVINRSKKEIHRGDGNLPEVKCYVEDITGSLATWTAQLEQEVKRNHGDCSDLIRFLEKLEVVPGYKLHRKYDVIFSVNLLSQIGIYWRDRVQAILSKLAGLDTDDQGNFDIPLQRALEQSMAKLQNQHLQLLIAAQPKLIVMITDRLFHFYERDQANWLTEPALLIGDAQLILPSYEIASASSWLWHIAPQGIEQPDYGSIHEVVALAFRRVC